MTSDGPAAERTARPEGSAAPAGTPLLGRAVAVVVLVALVVLGAALAGPWHMASRPQNGRFDRFLSRHVVPPPPPTAPPTPPAFTGPGPGPQADMALADRVALIAVAIVVLLVLARILLPRVRVRRRQRIDDATPPGWAADIDGETAVPAVREGLRAAQHALQADVPPGDAVIAAWMALERAAEASGVARDPAQTATEFTVAVLDGTQADPASTRALLQLYLQARFSSHPLTAEHVAAARADLARLADGVTHRRAAR